MELCLKILTKTKYQSIQMAFFFKYTNIYARTHIYVRISVYVCVYVYTYAHIYVWI